MAAPTLTSSNPTTLPRDGKWHTVALVGTNFATGIAVTSSTPGVSTTAAAETDATDATVKVLVAQGTPQGPISLTITNLDAGTVTDNTHTPSVVSRGVSGGALDTYAANPVPGAKGTSVAGTVSDNVVVALGPQSPSAAPFQDAVASPMASTHYKANPAWDPTNELAGGAPGGVQGSSAGNPGLRTPPGGDDTGDLEQDAGEMDTESVPLGDHTAQLPNVPTSVTAVAGAAGHATVNWVAPVDADGYGITGYTVTATTTDGGTSPISMTVAGTALTANVAGLTSAKHYTFAVVATNIAGTSVASTSTSAVLIA